MFAKKSTKPVDLRFLIRCPSSLLRIKIFDFRFFRYNRYNREIYSAESENRYKVTRVTPHQVFSFEHCMPHAFTSPLKLYNLITFNLRSKAPQASRKIQRYRRRFNHIAFIQCPIKHIGLHFNGVAHQNQ